MLLQESMGVLQQERIVAVSSLDKSNSDHESDRHPNDDILNHLQLSSIHLGRNPRSRIAELLKSRLPG
jgi:hypothetical protein